MRVSIVGVMEAVVPKIDSEALDAQKTVVYRENAAAGETLELENAH